jgi:hypothetical protein
VREGLLRNFCFDAVLYRGKVCVGCVANPIANRRARGLRVYQDPANRPGIIPDAACGLTSWRTGNQLQRATNQLQRATLNLSSSGIVMTTFYTVFSRATRRLSTSSCLA